MDKYIDTHAHYDSEEFDEDRGEVFRKLFDAGIEKIICPAVKYDSIRNMMDILEQYTNIYFALGQHPKYILSRENRKHCLHKTPKYKDLHQYLVNAQSILDSIKDQISEISKLLCKDRICAVGEVGLDYSYGPGVDEKALQSVVLTSYVEIALKQKLPLILHIRDAHEDALNILRSYNTRFTGVIHCFRGNKNLADQYIDLGFSIGVGTSIINLPQLREAVRYIDLDNIVLETDSPYLSLDGITDDRNTSLSLPLIAEVIAKEKDIPLDQVAEATYNNSNMIFHL